MARGLVKGGPLAGPGLSTGNTGKTHEGKAVFIYVQRPAEKRRTGFLRAALEDGAEAGGRWPEPGWGARGCRAQSCKGFAPEVGTPGRHAGDAVSETWVLDLIPGTAFLDLEPQLKAVSHLVMEKPPSSTQREV